MPMREGRTPNLYVGMYLFAIDKKLLMIVHHLILQSMKLSNYIFTIRITLYSDMRQKHYSV